MNVYETDRSEVVSCLKQDVNPVFLCSSSVGTTCPVQAVKTMQYTLCYLHLLSNLLLRMPVSFFFLCVCVCYYTAVDGDS